MKPLVSFERHRTTLFPDWAKAQNGFLQSKISVGLIDEDGKDFIKIDFADKYIGGYTLGPGLVQEEILFITAPEHIVAMLIVEKLEDDECLIMTGCEKFSSYSGYSKSFKFKGNYIDKSSRDKLGRKHIQWIAMDAQSYHTNPELQFEAKNIIRDLNKSYCAFSASKTNQSAIVTGNWGCGIFQGNVHLKVNYYTSDYTGTYNILTTPLFFQFIIQMLSAAMAHRDLLYLTFDDKKLSDELRKINSKLKSRTVSEVYKIIISYNDYLDAEADHEEFTFYDFFQKQTSFSHCPLQ